MTEELPLLALTGSAPKAPKSATATAQRRRFIGRATIGFAVALLATSALMALSWSTLKRASSLELEAVMDAYRAQQFSGVVRVSHNGERKFSDWMGLANEEFEAPMLKHSIFSIGSHSKLFTSVAMHQLQERGRVNLSHPVNAYLDESDFAHFGFPNQTTWCPHVDGSDDCGTVTFVQLLYMGSGIRDDSASTSAACASSLPQSRSCTPESLTPTRYKGSIAKHVAAFVNQPLAFRPGSGYLYAHANYVLLSYLIEKLSGQPLDAYFSEHIFAPLGLKKTYYDPYSGGRNVLRGFVNQYANLYVQTPAQDSSGRHTRAYVSTGVCGPYPDSGALSGAGGIHSTVKDMHRVYKDLFLHRGQRSNVLREDSIRALLLTRNPTRGSYAQGIVVAFEDEDLEQLGTGAEATLWPSKISYCGRMRCAATCMAMQTTGADSVISAAFTNHVEYTFPSHDVFAHWQPNSGENSSSQSAAGDVVVRGDYQVAELSWALLDIFLRYFKENESR